MPTENENQEASWIDKVKTVTKIAAPYAYNAAKNLLPLPARILAEGVEAADNGTLGLGPALTSGALQQPIREALGMPGKQIDESYFSPEQLEVLKRATALHLASKGEKDRNLVNGYAANEAMGEYNHFLEHQANSNAGYFGALANNPLDLLSSTLGSYWANKDNNGSYVATDDFDFTRTDAKKPTTTANRLAQERIPFIRKMFNVFASENNDDSSKNSATHINANLGNLDKYIEAAKAAIDPNEKPSWYVTVGGTKDFTGYPHAKALDYRKPLK